MAKAETVSFQKAYERRRVQTAPVGESLTQQHHAEDADVRNIIKKYDRTGLISSVNRGVAKYGDFTEVNEYADALNMIISANESFMQLPSNIREQFANDPGEFFEFATNPANEEAMINMGLKEAPVEAPKEDKVAAEPPAPQQAGE
jgi:phage internal scaffolding protein